MINDRSQKRDAAIQALLPLVPQLGWTMAALRQAAGTESDFLFPGGPVELVEAYIDLADRDMAKAALPLLCNQKISQRVRTLIATRLDQASADKPAVRRATAILAHPANLAAAIRCTARTTDAVWFAAGDTSTDFSWYTKRAILATIYSATLLFWLQDAGDNVETFAFLDRQLTGIAQIGRWRRRLTTPSATSSRKVSAPESSE